MNRRELAGMPVEPEFEDDDDLPELPPLGEYLTSSSGCDKIEPRSDRGAVSGSTLEPRSDRDAVNQPIDKGDIKMSELTPAQKAAQERAQVAKAKAEATAKEKAAAAKAKADAAAAKAKAKAEKEAAKAKAAKEAAATKERIAKERAAAKAKAEKERAEKKAAKEKEAAAKAAAREAAKAEREARRAAGGAPRLVPANLAAYHFDKEKKTAGGNISVDCGDKLAVKLRGMSLEQVFAEAAMVLGEKESDLRTKYAHLNPGMQRMNLGNRMRAAQAKGH